MRNSFTVSKTSLIVTMIFLTQFITLPYFAWYNVVKYIAIVIVGVYVCIRYKKVDKRKYALINMISVIFCGMLLWTSFQNRNQIASRNPFLAAIVFSALFMVFLLFMEIMIENNKVDHILNIFYRLTIIILFINDILIFVYPNLYLSFGENYFIGTKFEVIYLHFLSICLYMIKEKNKKFKNVVTIGMLIWTFFIGLQIKCSTGLVGAAFLVVLIIAINKKEEMFLNPLFYAGVQAICFGFVFFCENVLSSPNVQNFIVNILGKNATMSGRANIYMEVPILLTSNHAWITGFGYATSYELGRKLGGFPDTQNAILEWIWYAGVPTTIIMIMLFMLILYVSRKSIEQDRRKMSALLIFLYLLTILGTVEITITQLYFSIIVCIMGVGLSRFGGVKTEEIPTIVKEVNIKR